MDAANGKRWPDIGREGVGVVARHRVLGISFDHMHMGDLLREVAEHPDAEIAGVFDPDRARMEAAIAKFGIPEERVFTNLETCLAMAGAGLAIVCSASADHAAYVEKIAPHGLHVLVEKPFATSVADARRMIAAMKDTGRRLAINWPLAWYPCHVTAKRLLDDGAIGDLVEVHYYDGNRGPLFHLADKVEVSPEEVEASKPTSWWYKKAAGGGSLLDYLGYGATLGTWYMGGEAPIEVTSVVDHTPGIEVDQHSAHRLPLCPRPVEVRDPLGHLLRSLDAAAAAEMRLRPRRHARHAVELRLRGPRHPADPRRAGADSGAGRHAAAGPTRPDRVHARPHRRRSSHRRAARPRPLPRRAEDRRQRRAFVREQAHRRARRMSETPDLDARPGAAGSVKG